jgi:septum formation protein
MGNLILASASPRRKEIMELMGLRFIVQPSQCEEIVTETIPENIVIELSRQKAIDVAKTAQPGDVIIGSDTIVVLRQQQQDVSESKEVFEVLGKPKDREHGFRMLRSMAGRTHQVYTGVTILKLESDGFTDGDHEARRTNIKKQISFAECTDVHVADLSDEEINAYLDTNEYRDKAGGYGIQGRFAPYISGINGDYYNVMGLPAAALYQKLKGF